MNKKDTDIESRLPENPLIRDLVIPATSGLSFEEFQKGHDGFYEPRPILRDRSPHIKIFHDSQAVSVVNQLPECAKCLFIFILFKMKYGKDYIKIDNKEYTKATGVKSRTTLTKAKAELYRLRFIEPTSLRSIYFINPAYFFCGSRTAKYKNNIQITYTEKQL